MKRKLLLLLQRLQNRTRFLVCIGVSDLKGPVLKAPVMNMPDLLHEAGLGFFQGKIIIGVDEVGRGCLAGPVVAGACALDVSNLLTLGFSTDGSRPLQKKSAALSSTLSSRLSGVLLRVKDSKLIPEPDRKPMAIELSHSVLGFSVSECTVDEIAELNILHASMRAMEKAVDALEEKLGRMADVILVDGNRVPSALRGRGQAIVKGDLKSLSIASASIFAKVHRDELMLLMDQKYPEYGFAKHKGYPTPAHKAAIKNSGVLSIHRQGFRLV